jgi:predicted nucleic acid-binding protein
MKVLLDTNIIVDNLALREPHHKYAKEIFNLIAKKRIAGYVNTSSVTDIYYILRKTFSDTDSRKKIRVLLDLLHTVEVTKADCFAALDSPIKDFEDALVAICADKENLDFIITRDIEFLKLPNAILPNEFLKKINI